MPHLISHITKRLNHYTKMGQVDIKLITLFQRIRMDQAITKLFQGVYDRSSYIYYCIFKLFQFNLKNTSFHLREVRQKTWIVTHFSLIKEHCWNRCSIHPNVLHTKDSLDWYLSKLFVRILLLMSFQANNLILGRRFDFKYDLED